MSLSSESGGAKRIDVFYLVFLAALVWAPFIVRICQGLSSLSPPLTHDVGFQWIPFKTFARECFSAGYFPLWCPRVFAGMPFAAFSHTGVFYPPGLVLLAGDYARAVNYFYPAHLCVAAFGVYALCRRSGASPAGSFFGALSYAFTGKPFYFIHFLPAACSNVWAPWLIWSAVGFLRHGRRTDFFLSGLFFCLQVLGGDVESTAYGLAFTALVLPALAPREKLFSARTPALALALGLGALLCMVQLLPLLEYSEHFIRDQGVTFSYFSARKLPLTLAWGALMPVSGVKDAGPAAFDAAYFYVGVAALVMAVSAVLGRSRPGLGWIALVAASAFAWSFGSFSILDRLQFLLPVLGKFGSPEQAFFMAQTLVALLAAIGFSDALSTEARPRALKAALVALVLAVLAISLGSSRFQFVYSPLISVSILSLCLLMVIVTRMKRPSAAGKVLAFSLLAFAFWDVYAQAFFRLPKSDPATFEYGDGLKAIMKEVAPSNQRHVMVSRRGLRDGELLFHAGMAMGTDSLDGWITVPPRDFAEFAALADPRAARFKDGKLDHLGLNVDMRDGGFIDASSMPLLDLLSLRYVIDRAMPLKFSSPFFLSLLQPELHRRTWPKGQRESSPPWKRDAEDPLGEGFFSSSDETRKYRLFINEGDRLVLAPPSAAGRIDEERKAWFTASVHGGATDETLFSKPIESAKLAAGQEKFQVGLGRYINSTVLLTLETKTDPGSRTFAAAAPTSYIVNKSKPFQLIDKRGKDLLVYENREALPRAFLVGASEVIEDKAKRLSRLSRMSRYEFTQRLVLEWEGPPASHERPSGSNKDEVRLESSSSQGRLYSVSSSKNGYLFLSDQYYPGWKATVKGKPRPILKANHCFRAVKVDEGRSAVEISFQPASFRVGLYTTLTGALCLAVAAGFGLLRPGKK